MNKARTEKISMDKLNTNLKDSFLHLNLMLVRNYANLPFPSSLSGEQKTAFETNFLKFLNKKKKNISISKIGNLNDKQKLFLLNKGFWQKGLAERPDVTVAYSQDIAIFLNYKNHLSIVGSCDSLSVKNIYRKVKELENKLSEFGEYLISARYGYLSPHFEQCGLGLKISALLHLASLSHTKSEEETEDAPSTPSENNFMRIKQQFYDRGYQIERSFWEDSPEGTDYYEISSRFNFGVTEIELLERFETGLKDFAEWEMQNLKKYYDANKNRIDDLIYRSFGILRYAKKIEMTEAMTLLSHLRMGVKLKLPLPVTIDLVNLLQNVLMSSELEKIIQPEDGEAVIIYPIARAALIQAILEENHVR